MRESFEKKLKDKLQENFKEFGFLGKEIKSNSHMELWPEGRTNLNYISSLKELQYFKISRN